MIFLGIGMNAKDLLLEIVEKFQFKRNRMEPPETYLGGRLKKKNLIALMCGPCLVDIMPKQLYQI